MAAARAYILGCAGPVLSPDEAAFFAEAQPWGFILFARNVVEPDQLRALTRALREAVGREAPIFIDQEGGRVARLRAPHWREWLPPLEQVAINKRHGARAMYLRYRLIADELRKIGIDGNCAPVADIARANTHPVLKNRCYGEDVVKVAEIAGAVAQALLDGGVLPVVKHMPGQGRAASDSHVDLPRVKASYKALRWSDFMAFEPLCELPIAMSAHVIYEAIDAERPATQSPRVMALIREELGFEGLMLSDDLSMGALSGTLAARARASLAAGCDLVLHCNGVRDEMEALAASVRPLEGGALARAERALAWRRPALPIDIDAAEAEFHALMQGRTGADG